MKLILSKLRKARQSEEHELAKAYREAASDPGQLETVEDWKTIEGEDFQGVECDE